MRTHLFPHCILLVPSQVDGDAMEVIRKGKGGSHVASVFGSTACLVRVDNPGIIFFPVEPVLRS